MILTISGMPGSGKSTIAKILSEKLHLKHYSTGNFRREMAKRMNISINELNKLGETQDYTDKEADAWQENIGKTQNNFIIDGRLSFHFIPNSIKIFLSVSPEIGAERIRKDNRREEKSNDKKEAIKLWEERVNSDKLRYIKYYNIDPYNPKNFDLILDTSSLTPEEVVSKIVHFINQKP